MNWTWLVCLICRLHFAAGAPQGARDGSRYEETDEAMRGFIPGDNVKTNWENHGKAELQKALEETNIVGPAKNVILFIGDGMGVSTTSLARIFKAQLRRLTGDSAYLSWELFPHSSLARTYDTSNQVPDSAPTATAMLCGQKTGSGAVGVNQYVPRGDCSATEGNELKSILKYAEEEGKWTGVVTTTRVTHATPASSYASVAERGWEADTDDPACDDIAAQLVVNGPKIRVVMGGGRQMFFPNTTEDDEYPEESGHRYDGRNLIEEWRDTLIDSSDGLNENNVLYVQSYDEFEAVDTSSVEYLMGLFQPSHMNYEVDRENDTFGEPSLAEMVGKTIDILSRNNDGFFLLVEGGRIDHAHHANAAHKAMMDTIALQDAVQEAVDKTDQSDTLIVVTADHSHAFTFQGYPSLDRPAMGLVGSANDGKVFTTAGYSNGPGWYVHRAERQNDSLVPVPRKDIEEEGWDTLNPDYIVDAAIPLNSETHAGEDVSLHAVGPMSHLFHGTKEQNFVFHVMMHAACLGDDKELCSSATRETMKVPHILLGLAFYFIKFIM